ncbi:hypothetical protein DICVIV_01310 [Dictyocaulus viviparus]|uniref:C-Jun-amino-terminal kinase-interacting protein 4 n=1 Tax=Dictyocaulus viviparus TaxID=29172 RepID=A0A0D8Y6V8_DICVI|nr:hypothetical protein DICVIV_01310 [Dictyocaulus viviparus]
MVPVPVCCRPLIENQPSIKVWCATAVILRGGINKNGKYITGSPVFFSPSVTRIPRANECNDKLENEISRAHALDARENELAEWEMSSLVWVGSSNQGRSLVTVLDANNPENIIETFVACESHLLCIKGIPGDKQLSAIITGSSLVFFFVLSRIVQEFTKVIQLLMKPEQKHFCVAEEKLKTYLMVLQLNIPFVFYKKVKYLLGIESSDLGACELVELRKMDDSEDGVPTYCSNEMRPSPKRTRDFSVNDTDAVAEPSEAKSVSMEKVEEISEEESAQKSDLSETCTLILLEKSKDQKVKSLRQPRSSTGRDVLPQHVRDALSKYEEKTEISTGWPTVWLGSQNQYFQKFDCIKYLYSFGHKLLAKMSSANQNVGCCTFYHVGHYKGRVFAALANGTLAVFHRGKDGVWADFYHTIRIGPATSSVRCLCVVNNTIWAAYKNCIVVVDGERLQIVKVFAAHPRRDSQVRAVQWVGAGVWLSIRLDSTLRLYHAHTYEHLQDVDIEPYVTKMLGTSRLDFSYMRTTALLVSNRRMWIGTGTGVVISVPLSNSIEQKVETCDAKNNSGPGGLVRVYSSSSKDTQEISEVTMGSGPFIPYCNLTQAQLSFHGHKDSVKFFLAVPGAPRDLEDDQTTELRRMLLLSGGDGYIDFRIGEENEPQVTSKGVRTRDMSHLIIWELDAELPVVSN